MRLLRGKYHQYETMRIEENPVIAMRPEKAVSWGALDGRESHDRGYWTSIHGRRSVRRYLSKEVPDEIVEQVLEAARWAPSPHGRQPWRFAVHQARGDQGAAGRCDGRGVAREPRDGRPERRRSSRGASKVPRRRLLDAPVLVLLCLYLEDLDEYPDAERQRGETTMAVQSLGAAAQNALLAAYDLGLDAGWMCAPLFCPEKVVEALGLDQRLVPHALLTLGYAARRPAKTPRTRRRSTSSWSTGWSNEAATLNESIAGGGCRFPGRGNGGGTVGDAELVEDVDQVRLHGGFAEVQVAPDLLVAHAARHELEDLDLPAAQVPCPGSRAVASGCAATARARRLAAGGGLTGAEQLLPAARP